MMLLRYLWNLQLEIKNQFELAYASFLLSETNIYKRLQVAD
ncbi:hypothetical protein F898_03229 [Acinetobacter courvalinii]|nr:hypothetical protein F898_03229 [Acinetobacter courvalinii]